MQLANINIPLARPAGKKCTHRSVIHLNRVWSLAKGFKQHALDFMLNFRERRRSSSSTQRFKQTSHMDTFPAAAPSQDKFELRAAGQQNRLHSLRKLRTISYIALRPANFWSYRKARVNSWRRSIHRPALAHPKSPARRRSLPSFHQPPNDVVDARAMKRSVTVLTKGALWRSSRAWGLSSPRRDLYVRTAPCRRCLIRSLPNNRANE